MVRTRGEERNSNSQSMEEKLKSVQQKLDRSEQKLQIIMTWIRENFGETNFLFDELWKILREFDENSKVGADSGTGTFTGELGRQTALSEIIHRKESTLEEPLSNSGKGVRITDVKSLAARSSAQTKLIPTNWKSAGKVGQTAYVLVESLDMGTASLTPISQAALKSSGQFASKQQKDLPESEGHRRTRKQSHKLTEAQMSGDESDEVAIPNRNLRALDDGDTDDEDNGDSLSVNSDPLRLSNPPSPDGSTSNYEPNFDDIDESDLEEISTSTNTFHQSISVSAIPKMVRDPNATSVYSCTNCDKKFVTSRSFAKHQLIHDILKDSGEDIKLETESPCDYQLDDSPLPSLGSPRFNKLLKRRIYKPRKSKIKVPRRVKIAKARQPKPPRPVGEKRKPGPKPKAVPSGPLICEMCGKTLNTSRSLERHIKWVHAPDGAKETHPCLVCEKVLATKGTLDCHMRTVHAGIKPYLCSICGQTFARTGTLKMHMQTHSEVRQFKCSYCNVTFRQKNGLMVHINRHLGRLEKHCTICGLGHASSNNLKKHMNAVHGNHRPHKCHLCDKAFKERNHLKYHLKTHDNPNGRKRGLNRALDPEFTAKGSKRGQNMIQSGKPSKNKIVRLVSEVSFPNGQIQQQSQELIEKIAQERLSSTLQNSTEAAESVVRIEIESDKFKGTTEPTATIDERFQVVAEKEADEVTVGNEDIIDHTWLLNVM